MVQPYHWQQSCRQPQHLEASLLDVVQRQCGEQAAWGEWGVAMEMEMESNTEAS